MVTKRSGDTEAKVLIALRSGHTRRVAAASAGINERTLQEWLADENFNQAAYEAECEAERFHIANINRAAASGLWGASKWWLEARHPADYARVDRAMARMLVELTELRDELKREGIEISDKEILEEYAQLSAGRPALPSGRKASAR